MAKLKYHNLPGNLSMINPDTILQANATRDVTNKIVEILVSIKSDAEASYSS